MKPRPTPTEPSDEATDSRHAEVQSLLDDAAADLEAFLDPDTDHSIVVRTRRAAAHDRNDSKSDRLSAADDRSRLAPDHGAAEPSE